MARFESLPPNPHPVNPRIDYLQPGQRVYWTSHAGRHFTTKKGWVVAVIPPGRCPNADGTIGRFRALGYSDKKISQRFRRGRQLHPGRTHETYLVVVGPFIYWPSVQHLRVSRVMADKATWYEHYDRAGQDDMAPPA